MKFKQKCNTGAKWSGGAREQRSNKQMEQNEAKTAAQGERELGGGTAT